MKAMLLAAVAAVGVMFVGSSSAQAQGIYVGRGGVSINTPGFGLNIGTGYYGPYYQPYRPYYQPYRPYYQPYRPYYQPYRPYYQPYRPYNYPHHHHHHHHHHR